MNNNDDEVFAPQYKIKWHTPVFILFMPMIEDNLMGFLLIHCPVRFGGDHYLPSDVMILLMQAVLWLVKRMGA